MGQDFDPNAIEPPKHRPDYTIPIARVGEEQFAAIKRNRSGFDAGEIDFALRSLDDLGEYDKQQITDTAFGLYQAICRQTNRKATNDDAK